MILMTSTEDSLSDGEIVEAQDEKVILSPRLHQQYNRSSTRYRSDIYKTDRYGDHRLDEKSRTIKYRTPESGRSELSADGPRSIGKVSQSKQDRNHDRSDLRPAKKLKASNSPVSEANNVTELTSQDYDDYYIEQQEPDEEAIRTERKRRREAILAKYRNESATPPSEPVSIPTPNAELLSSRDRTPETVTVSPEFNLQANPTLSVGLTDGRSAVDYDPVDDRKEILQYSKEPTAFKVENDIENKSSENEVVSFQRKDENHEDDIDDMFDVGSSDSENDIFADTSISSRRKSINPGEIPVVQQKAVNSLHDNFDDDEGYYRVIIGELLDGRYHVQANLGKGMFSSVVKAVDNQHSDGTQVAIKIIRNNDIMHKAGMKEMGILESLNSSDPDDKKHLIRLLRHFDHKGHLCLVFESMSINLREVLKRFGRDVGISLPAVRAYAQQMFLALLHLRRNNILHADIKPDNILVNENRAMLKVCDLGSASDVSENDITPYLVSRFYRAPEVILGLPYDFAIDTWSIGCTLYELYTGRILFPGNSNNNMLKVIMDTKGFLPQKLLRRGGKCVNLHFDQNLNFLSRETDRVTGKLVTKVVPYMSPSGTIGMVPKDIKGKILSASGKSEDKRTLASFIDLVEKCTTLIPEKRLTPSEALRHPFLKG
ncbi:kinase-like domain-containing protein [Dipodascopsis uninucleata]